VPALEPHRRVTELPSAQVTDPQVNNAGALVHPPTHDGLSLRHWYRLDRSLGSGNRCGLTVVSAELCVSE
jgi:hypothetical protein